MYVIAEVTSYKHAHDTAEHDSDHRLLIVQPTLEAANCYALHHFLTHVQPHSHDWHAHTLSQGELVIESAWEESSEVEGGGAASVTRHLIVQQLAVGDEQPVMDGEEYKQQLQRLQQGARMSRDDMY